jgi:hypothetical protein
MPGSWLPVWPTVGPGPAILEAFCPDHGVRYCAAQPLLDDALANARRTKDNPASSRPERFSMADRPVADARPVVVPSPHK